MCLVIEESHVLLQDQVEHLASIYSGDMLGYDVADPSHDSKYKEIAERHNEEHSR
jgi:hypothetical protein